MPSLRRAPALALALALGLPLACTKTPGDEGSGTGGKAPGDPCAATSECAGGVCAAIPCEVDPSPGCGEFRCVAECVGVDAPASSSLCRDDAACCVDACPAGVTCSDAGACLCEADPSTSTGSSSSGSTSATATTSEGDTTTSSSSSGTTGEPLPAPCMATSECPNGQHCLNKPCEVVMDEPGCGVFRCYVECSSPFDESGLWTCADAKACCGGYPCDGGACTEYIGSTG